MIPLRRCRAKLFSLLLVTLATFIAAGCGTGSGEGSAETSGGQPTTGEEQQSGGRSGELTVFAAASLTDAFKELATNFEEQNPGANVRTNFAGSSTLATQLVQGAPADVYASADKDQMDKVQKDGLVAGKPETFVKNAEVVTVPADNPAGIKEFADLSQDGVNLVLAAKDVPVADYAVQILGNATPALGESFKQDVLDNLVSREADTRAAIQRVAQGDADATFSYSSDVTPDIRDQVEIIEIPEEFNVIPTYPIATLKDAKKPELAQQWVEFVMSDQGQKVLEKWGFQPVSMSDEGTSISGETTSQ